MGQNPKPAENKTQSRQIDSGSMENLIRDLTRAKCEVQLRSIMTAMGLPDPRGDV